MYFSNLVLATILSLPAVFSIAIPQPFPLSPDPAGAKNIGNGKGGQFIGGACLSQADCASACCATLNGAGICSGPGAQFQAGKQGCGFGGSGGNGAASPPPPPAATINNNNAASASGVTVDNTIPGSSSVGKGNAQQFITGQCASNSDCASGCCAGLPTANKGPTFAVCSGPAVGNQAGKTGCGFTVNGSKTTTTTPAPIKPVAGSTSGTGKDAFSVDTSIPGSSSVGKGNAIQFITGQCTSNADCASGCCAGLPTANKGSSFAVCSGPAVGNQAGKTGCGFKLKVSPSTTSEEHITDQICSD